MVLALRRVASAILPLATRDFARWREFGAEVPMNGVLCLRRTGCCPSFGYSTVTNGKQRASNRSLVNVIDYEIKCALESDLNDCELDIPDDFPFEIRDEPGTRGIVLMRGYEDERIKVEVGMPDNGVKKEDDDETLTNDDKRGAKLSPCIPLTVNISRKGMVLKFGAVASPDVISIRSMLVMEKGSSDDQLQFKGPEFSDLKENLQKSFHEYLKVRGLNPSTANVLLECMIIKDSTEYLWWLRCLRKFVQDEE